MNPGQQSYPAHAFHPHLGTETVSGVITFEPLTLRFESEMGVVYFPLRDLQIQKREASGDRIFFTHPLHSDWKIYTSDLSILDEKIFSQNIALRAQVEAALQIQSRGLRKLALITVVAAAVFFVIAALVFCLTGSILDILVARVPPKFEVEMGDEQLKEVQARLHLLPTNEITVELTTLVKSIAPPEVKSKFDLQVYLLPWPIANAFALPGGKIVVCSGLLTTLKSRDEVAGVLAHEVAHVARRHHLRRQIAAAGPYFILKMFVENENGTMAMIGKASNLMFRQGFSQQYENQADDTGWDYLLAANINPHAMIDCLDRLDKEHRPDTRWKLISSHPPTQARIHRLQTKWDHLPAKSGFVAMQGMGVFTNEDKLYDRLGGF